MAKTKKDHLLATKEETDFYLCRLLIMYETQLGQITDDIESADSDTIRKGYKVEMTECLTEIAKIKKCIYWVKSINP